ncbi:MAG: TRAP transporter substrate-binding protein [Janthinobacterium lividum]
MKIAIALMCCVVMFSKVAEAKDIDISIGTLVPANSTQGEATVKFAKLVNAKNAGIHVQIFPGGQLGEGSQEVENVREGIQGGFIDDLTFYLPYSPGMRVANVPFLFRDRAMFASWLASPIFAAANADVEKKGNQHVIIGVQPWWRGPFRVLVSTKPITTLDDVRQMRLRLWNSETITRYWGKGGLGATITDIPWSQVYLALSQGVIDAVTSPFDLLTSSKFTEVAKNVTMIDEYPQVVTLSINEDIWKSLSPQQRAVIEDAWTEGGQIYNAEVQKNVPVWRAQMEAQGAKFLPIERAAFSKYVNDLSLKLEQQGYWPKGFVESIQSLK